MSLQTQLYQFSHRFDIPVLIGRWRSTLAAAEPHASPSLLGPPLKFRWVLDLCMGFGCPRFGCVVYLEAHTLPFFWLPSFMVRICYLKK